MDIYSSSDYREIIKNLFKAQKEFQKGLTYQKMAEFMRIQKPYLSKVLNGHADFSTDQLFKIQQFLNISEQEYDYISLLLEIERTQFPERKKELQKKVSRLQSIHSEAGRKTRNEKTFTASDFDVSDIVEFYLDPLISVVHVCLSIKAYRENTDKIAKDLNITEDRLSKILFKLEKMKIIKIDKKEITILINHLSLPKDSNVTVPYQKLMTQLCAQRKGDLNHEDKKSFNTVFASTEKTRKKIEFEFSEFIGKVREIVTNSEPGTGVYHLSFDLFPWT